ncbi:DUF3369 domain-containing protein [Azospirillum thermophilum]|uniref:Transcriptional regulator n=1 Tax=Azospirillum thermophilum TaxID=2202148 RepID=A0A2S2CTG6_9PROT|nr:DUF3369 domain-containing protein [Azospirillum thermophilum]AWK87759.1 transcriptional regulator [Azospirillum thermophilum]
MSGDLGDDLEDDPGGGDELRFLEEPAEEPAAARCAAEPWKILIADDDHEVHAITRVVLSDVRFQDRPILFLSAYSAAEARAILAAERDLAAVLLDVVMETDDAGLRLVRHIREELGNHAIRIILRTGQPGQAPERQVIANYDINDYKAKSELTSQKLFTTTVAALRSYQHIAAIERNRQGLETIVDSIAELLEQRSRDRFVDGVVTQVRALLPAADGAALFSLTPEGETALVAGSGSLTGAGGPGSLAGEVLADLASALAGRHSLHRDGHSVLSLRTRHHPPAAIVLTAGRPPGEIEQRLLDIFCGKLAVGFDNLHLHEEVQRAQVATVHALGKLAEYKDEVTGDHVRRLGRWATAVARQLQAEGRFPEEVDDRFCELIGLASVLHDVGKVGIPDHILRKPGKLAPDEMATMREHAAIGGRILRDAAGRASAPTYLSMGADIAESHHEKFDGSGYPRGLAGDAIPLAGRIVAVADVFDALLHRRPYKEAWELADVIALLRTESGRHFDPRVVEAFIAVLTRDGVLKAA